MEISSKEEKGALVVSLGGKMDAVNAPEFEKAMEEILSGGVNSIVINLTELKYISSAGLRVILVTAKHIKEKKGTIVFAGLQGAVKDVFKMSGFNSIFQVYDTEEAALEQV